jgi:rhomboid protease GluP
MPWEIVLFSILAATAYRGGLLAWRRPFGSATAGYMLLATAALAGIALAGEDSGAAWWKAVGTIAVGAAAVQLIGAPLLRAGAAAALRDDRLRLAAVLVDIRDVLQPGTGGREEKRMIAALRDVKEGRVDNAIAALSALRDRAPANAKASLEERIIVLQISAQRWGDAVAHAEATLLAGPPPADRLPVSPPVYLELILAKLRLGDFDGAVDLAERFEAFASNVPELALLVHRLHLVFLAHAGRVADVERLLDRRYATFVGPGSHRYWTGVARAAAGDREGARAAYEAARNVARGDFRARALINEAVARLEAPPPTPTPRALAFAEHLAAQPVAVPPTAPARSSVVTTALIAANILVAAACTFLLAGSGDFGTVIRAGANARGLVDEGEPWRLASSVFVHIGILHLAINMLALWSLGRLVEGLFGRARMLAIYGVAGLAGALASYAGTAAGASAGASGAIFGLIGAALVELAVHRKRYRAAWRTNLVRSLAIVTIVQLGIGFSWKIVDNWAHIGGLVGGAVVALLLSPGWRWAERRAVKALATALAAALALVYAGSLVAVAATDYGDSLARTPRVLRATPEIALEVPATWRADGAEIGDPSLNLFVELALAHAPSLAQWEKDARELAIAHEFTSMTRAEDRTVALPADWQGSEWLLTMRDAMGSTQRYRMIVFVARIDDRDAVGLLFGPEVLLREGAKALAQILASARLLTP